MIGRRRRGAEGTSVLRVRLIASILVAALLPFLTAWWIARHVREAAGQGERRHAADVHRSLRRTRGVDGARRHTTARARPRAEPEAPAGGAGPQPQGDAPAPAPGRGRRAPRPFAALPRPGSAVPLPGVPAVSVVVSSGSGRLATVAVSAPTAASILKRARAAALPGTPDVLALVRDGVVVAGPRALRGGRVGSDRKLHVGGHRVSERRR